MHCIMNFVKVDEPLRDELCFTFFALKISAVQGSFSATLTVEDVSSNEKFSKGDSSKSGSGPFINPQLSPNVTGVLGKEVRLACHVEHLGNKTVNHILLNPGQDQYWVDLGFMDSSRWHSFADSWQIYLYFRPTIFCPSRSNDTFLAVANSWTYASRCWQIWMSGVHYSAKRTSNVP